MSGDNLLWTATTPSFVDWIHWSGNYSSNDSTDFLLDSTLMNDEDKGPVPPKPTLPIDMTFNDGHVVSIATYSVLLAISVCGNVTVLCNLTGRKHVTNPRVSIMLIHLAIADLLVTLLLMPIEIGWAATVQWRAGDAACRILAFFRAFGLFLSSFVLVCISIDRYGAILHPLQINTWKRRGKVMLAVAWFASFVCSLPQVFIFHVESHPQYSWYEQCVTFNSFPTRAHEISYAAFGMLLMYVLPLAVFVVTYGAILVEISRHSQEGSSEEGVRKISAGNLSRARIKTVKMTLVIIFVFILCWTPYNIMSIWFWCDRDSALQVDQRVQKGLFLFAVANSCVNPMVYGFFSRRPARNRSQSRHEFQRKVPYHPNRLAQRLAENNRTPGSYLFHGHPQKQNQSPSPPFPPFTPATGRSEIDIGEGGEGAGEESDCSGGGMNNKSADIRISTNCATKNIRVQVELVTVPELVFTTTEEKKKRCWIKLPPTQMPDVTVDTAV